MNPATCLGIGKVEELKARNETFDVLAFDREISPNQQKNLVRMIDREVIDRTRLILDIFARHAQSRQARSQVELADLNYRLPRLAGMWSHLDREKGGGVTSRGMGEKQINVDRNLIQRKIARLKKELKKIEGQKKVQEQASLGLLRVSLVGYTNAGKSSLMNAVTRSGVWVEDKLFATLDSTTRLVKSRFMPKMLLHDTVGFIRNIPHDLIASFHGTLKKVRDADLLLHVTDASDPSREEKTKAVQEVLDQIGAGDIPQITVFNKMDKVENDFQRLVLNRFGPASVCVSAKDAGCAEAVCEKIADHFARSCRRVKLVVPYRDRGAVSLLRERGFVRQMRHTGEGIEYVCDLSEKDYVRLGLMLPELENAYAECKPGDSNTNLANCDSSPETKRLEEPVGFYHPVEFSGESK